ncbi:hypothetical protein ACFLSE_10705 [Bacteroidota bacterium]
MIQKIRLLKKHALVALICLISSTILTAQEKYNSSPSEIKELLALTKAYYSFNDEIINGCVYPLPNSRIEGHPYLNDQWTLATIYINNKKFENQIIKFDLTINDIILKAELENGIEKLVNLNKFQVDSFIIGTSLFINSMILNSEENNTTYYEQIYKGKYSLYKKYDKIFIKEYNTITPYGKFSNLRTDMLLFANNEIHNADRKTSFLASFEKSMQKEIKSYMNKNSINYKKATDQQLKQLMNYCSALTTK